jgi:hypothetical protein
LSWDILLHHLELAYADLRRGLEPRLPARTDSFGVWAQALLAHARSEAFAADLEYWRAVTPPAGTAVAGRSPHDTVATARTAISTLDRAATERLLRRPAAVHGMGINAVLLTVLGRTLYDWTGNREIYVNMEGHGRDALDGGPDITSTVGWFTALYPVRVSLPDSDDPSSSCCPSPIRSRIALPAPGTGSRGTSPRPVGKLRGRRPTSASTITDSSPPRPTGASSGASTPRAVTISIPGSSGPVRTR